MDKNSQIITAIILKIEAIKDNDLKVSAYSQEEGKLTLFMRGALKNNSKLLGHVQPLSLTTLMLISSKNGQYIASAKNIEVYLNIRDNFKLLQLAGMSLGLYVQLIKNNYVEKNLYLLLRDWLELLDKNKLTLSSINLELYGLAFKFKFVSYLGLFPEIRICSSCHRHLSQCQEPFYFNKTQGNFSCSKDKNNHKTSLSLNSLKLMKFLQLEDFKKIERLLVSEKDVLSLVRLWREYMIYEFRDNLAKDSSLFDY